MATDTYYDAPRHPSPNSDADDDDDDINSHNYSPNTHSNSPDYDNHRPLNRRSLISPTRSRTPPSRSPSPRSSPHSQSPRSRSPSQSLPSRSRSRSNSRSPPPQPRSPPRRPSARSPYDDDGEDDNKSDRPQRERPSYSNDEDHYDNSRHHRTNGNLSLVDDEDGDDDHEIRNDRASRHHRDNNDDENIIDKDISGSSANKNNDDDSYRKDDDDRPDDDDIDDDGNRHMADVSHQPNGSGKNDDDDDDDDSVDNHLNGNSHPSDSDDQQPTRRRSRRSDKLILPKELRDDKEYFRRSSRSRAAPNRFSSPGGSGSSPESDGDFQELEDKTFEEEEEDLEEDDDDDDEDFNMTPPRTQRTTRSKRRTSPSTQGRTQDEALPNQLMSESGSDEDWRATLDGTKRIGRRRKKRKSNHSPSKRQRARDSEDEAQRAARTNSRGGQAVNYFESDDGEFLASDDGGAEGIGEGGAVDGTAHSNEPHVECVLDYRVRDDVEDGLGSVPSSASPYSDFIVENVELKVKWMNFSYRKCTWETWDTLKNVKGNKKVSHFIKRVEAARDNYAKEDVTPEEIEDVRVLREEQRTLYKEYEITERVISKRDNPEDESKTEYLVKWTKLHYLDATWEDRSELTSKEDMEAIDAFMERETNVLSQGSKKKFNPFNLKDDRPKFKKMAVQPDYLHGDGRTLRDYQLAGLNYLAFSWTKRNNVILADEMGLGKTLQSISFLGWLMYVVGIPGQFLVVVPLSTIEAWRREFMRWVPSMNVVCYIGNGQSRKLIRDYEFYSTEKKVEKFHVLLTTPELVMADQDYLMDIRWALVAVDEAHRLKNEASALHITLASLKSANRLLITGTPLQNSIRELWALLHFLNPDKFESAEHFEELFSFSAMRDPDRVSQLHVTLRPYIIRRQKGDVEKSLPKKTYSVLRVGMTSAQQQYYRWLLTRNFAKLNASASGKGRGMGPAQNIRNLLMELKKCCNHPFLFPNYEDTSTTTTVNDLIRASGKMILLDKLLIRLKEKGHRVLIFSQMVRMLDILQDYCRMRTFPCQRLDGSIENEIRQRAVDHFNAPDSTDFIFLLSTRAGGLGINLATADTVIIFDSDWNPQNDLQAESRAHRIGQKRDVKVFRFLTAETVEEDILERAKRKRVLEHVVIHGVEGGHKAEGKGQEMTFKKEELSAILRFGAEKLFAKDRLKDGLGQENAKTGNDGDSKVESTAIVKTEAKEEDKVEGSGNEDSNAPTADNSTNPDETEAKAEEKRVLAADDIDEILERAPEDETSQVGAAQPSIGDSLLNAFKWADFTVEEEDMEDPNDLGVDEDDNDRKEMARKAASSIIKMDREAKHAKFEEDREKEVLSKEGDSDFWNRIIPGEMKEGAIVNDMVLGTRRRKRPNTFTGDGDLNGGDRSKRRRVTRAGRAINGRGGNDEELSAKEKRSLLRSLRRFGDPSLVDQIIADAGLEHRIDRDVALALMNDCLERAKVAVREAHENHMQSLSGRKGRSSGIGRDDGDGDYENDDDPSYEGAGVSSVGRGHAKSSRITVDIMGEHGVDAVELLKRCEELMMMRRHLQTFKPDLHFRFKNTIKPPSYGSIRWKASIDAMLLVGVYRHGFGNWSLIARDTELGLEDKIAVSGNDKAKQGAPDSTKLSRRIITLLRELEKETAPSRGLSSTASKGRGRGRGRGKAKLGIKGDSRISKESSRGRSRQSGRWGSGVPSPSGVGSVKISAAGSGSRRDGRRRSRDEPNYTDDNDADYGAVKSKSKGAKRGPRPKDPNKISKGGRGRGRGRGRGSSTGGGANGNSNGAAGGPSGDGYREKRLGLKRSHLQTLRELLSLSKKNSTIEANEKIKRTKQCLLILGRGIEQHAGQSNSIEVDLWKYVHQVCKTQLPEDRLQAIYQRLAEAEEEGAKD